MGPLRVRMGVHTGEAELPRRATTSAREVNRAARLMAVAHGGQVVVSSVTGGLVRDGSVELVDLGEHRLRDFTTTERVFQVRAPGLVTDFPPLRSVDAAAGQSAASDDDVRRRERRDRVARRSLVRRSSLVTLTGRRWGRQDPSRAPGCGGGHRRVPGRCVVVRARAGHRSGGGVGDLGGDTAGAAAAGSGAGRVGARLSRGQAAAAGARQLRASPRRGRAPRRRDRAPLCRGCRCWRRAGKDSRWRASGWSRCRRWVSRPATRPSTSSGRRKRCACSRIGRAQRSTTSRSPIATSVLSRCCVDAWTGSRSRSSSQRRGSGHCHPRISSSRLDQRFKLLTHGSRAALERHQTLRNTIDWSYDLLTPTERQGLQRLSVFAGGCDLAAAEAVLPDDELDAADVVDSVGSTGGQVPRRRRRRGRRDALPPPRDHPPVRAGATRRQRRPGRGATPPRRLLRRAGRSGRPPPAEPRPRRVDQRHRA